MEKVQEMVAAMCEAATVHGIKHGLDNNEVMNALAHTYVIYGFTVQKKGIHPQIMKSAIVGCVAESCDRMIEANDYVYDEEA
jgi:hydrogenase/urease accessory protein HupE